MENLNTPAPENKVEKSSKALHITFLILQVVLLITSFFVLMAEGSYGWTLFLIIPFSIGLTIGTYTYTFKTRKLMTGFGITIFVIFVLCVSMITSGMEGMICVLMALGIIVVPAVMGAVVGYLLRSALKVYSLSLIFVLCSSSMVYDLHSDEKIETTSVESVVIKAPRVKVWEVLTHHVNFSRSGNLFFKAGVSYPTEMQMEKEKDGSCFLACKFNNGASRLKIEALDSLNTLIFSITPEIPHMKELTFYDELNAPHLEGYFKPGLGGFTLFEKTPNECVLVATTSYSYKITPAFYWKWWTDYLSNTMHKQVLNDVKTVAER